MPNKLRTAINNLLAVITAFFTPNKQSWHYRLIERMWTGSVPENRWKYWGFSVPVELPVGLVVNFVWFFALWLFGFSVDFQKLRNLSEGNICLPFRMTKRGRIKVFTPIGLVIVGIPIYMGAHIVLGFRPDIASFALSLTPLLFLTKKDNSKGTRSLEKQGHPAQ